MAIYRLEKKSISRGSNHNLVAAVAYRAGAKLTDSNKLNPKATTHDYTKKTDVAHSEVILPDELAEQLKKVGITLDLEQVANLVEQGETTKRGKMKATAKLANEYVLAGSHELSQDENIQAFQAFAKQQAEEQGVVAMVFVHDPKQGDDMSAGAQTADSQISKRTHPNRKKTSDIRNIHAHVVVLSRQLVLSGDQLELGDKSDSELSDTDRKKKGIEKSKDWLKGVREQWANIQNQSLERHNLAPVSHKSYQDLGVKFRPTKHLGKDATAMERQGLQTILGKYNESINQYNRVHFESATERLTGLTEQRTTLSEQQFIDSERSIEWANEAAEWTTEQTSWTVGPIRELNRRVASSKQCVENGKRDVTWAVRANEELKKLGKRNSKNTGWTRKPTEWASQGIEWANGLIGSTEQQTTRTTEQERRVNRLIAEYTRTRSSIPPSPFDDNARRARANRLAEQERRFDRDTDRNRWADERTAEAARRIKTTMAMVLLSRHTGMALQPWETIENYPEKLDTRQVNLLDVFAQTIGVDDKITDFINDSRRVAKFFTADVIEQNIEVFKLLRNPKVEREQYNKPFPKKPLSAPQSDLNEFTRDYVHNEPNSSNIANESVSIAPRRLRRP